MIKLLFFLVQVCSFFVLLNFKSVSIIKNVKIVKESNIQTLLAPAPHLPMEGRLRPRHRLDLTDAPAGGCREGAAGLAEHLTETACCDLEGGLAARNRNAHRS